MEGEKETRYLLRYTDPRTGMTYDQCSWEREAEFYDRVFQDCCMAPLLKELGCRAQEVRVLPEYWAVVVTFSKAHFEEVPET